MKTQCMQWALSYKSHEGRRFALPSDFGWVRGHSIAVTLFPTRAEARDAKGGCRFNPTRIERVQVTVEACVEVK